MDTDMQHKARAAQREYMRKWRAEHRDSVRAAQLRYWSKKWTKNDAELQQNQATAENEDQEA